MDKKLNIAVVGLRFGAEFPAIYRDHPHIASVTICERNETLLNEFGNKFGFTKRVTDFNALLADESIDAIHIVSDIFSHYDLTMAALQAGKHCACTVPMATTIDQLRDIITAQKASGKNFMMMETAVYTFQCLYVQEMIQRGELGRVQYLRGTHFQDMENWPEYWMGLPPFWYATHAISPLMHLSGARAKKVYALGSGVLTESYKARHNNPFPIETAIMELEAPDGKPLAAEFGRSLFNTARSYVEGFTVFGEKKSFEWDMEYEPAYVFEMENGGNGRGNKITETRVQAPDYANRLPEGIRKFTKRHTILDPHNQHQSVEQGGGHHGSHPHMIHEFVMSIVENRKPMIDAVTAANWNAPGICAHESAMAGGKEIIIPTFA